MLRKLFWARSRLANLVTVGSLLAAAAAGTACQQNEAQPMASPHDQTASPHGQPFSPHGQMGAAGDANTASGSPVSGIISLSKGATVQPGNVLYIIAKTEGSPAPVAVKRISNPTFPVMYSLGPENAIMPGMPFQGPLTIRARLSRTGDALPHAGDIEGNFPKPVSPGDKDVDIYLAQVL